MNTRSSKRYREQHHETAIKKKKEEPQQKKDEEEREYDPDEYSLKVEFAKSNRSKCKRCKTMVPKDQLRIGTVCWETEGAFKIVRWFHLVCFELRGIKVVYDEIAGFEDLNAKNQAFLRDLLEEKLLESNFMAPSKPLESGGVAHPPSEVPAQPSPKASRSKRTRSQVGIQTSARELRDKSKLGRSSRNLGGYGDSESGYGDGYGDSGAAYGGYGGEVGVYGDHDRDTSSDGSLDEIAAIDQFAELEFSGAIDEQYSDDETEDELGWATDEDSSSQEELPYESDSDDETFVARFGPSRNARLPPVRIPSTRYATRHPRKAKMAATLLSTATNARFEDFSRSKSGKKVPARKSKSQKVIKGEQERQMKLAMGEFDLPIPFYEARHRSDAYSDAAIPAFPCVGDLLMRTLPFEYEALNPQEPFRFRTSPLPSAESHYVLRGPKLTELFQATCNLLPYTHPSTPPPSSPARPAGPRSS